MAKFILPPVEPVLQLNVASAHCDWCGLQDDKCIISTLPIVLGHMDYATEIQLLKGSALFDRLKEVVVLAEKKWHELPEFAAVCIPCVQAIANLTKKGA